MERIRASRERRRGAQATRPASFRLERVVDVAAGFRIARRMQHVGRDPRDSSSPCVTAVSIETVRASLLDGAAQPLAARPRRRLLRREASSPPGEGRSRVGACGAFSEGLHAGRGSDVVADLVATSTHFRLLGAWLDHLPSVGYCHDRLDHELQRRRHHRPRVHSEASALGGDEMRQASSELQRCS
jgi:hypothetical protein